MKFTEIDFKRIMKKYQQHRENISLEEETELNILIFINTIHLNKQDFYAIIYDSHMYGDVELWFKKESNCLFGYCLATFKEDGRRVIIKYIFNEQGFERADRVLFKNGNL